MLWWWCLEACPELAFRHESLTRPRRAGACASQRLEHTALIGTVGRLRLDVCEVDACAPPRMRIRPLCQVGDGTHAALVLVYELHEVCMRAGWDPELLQRRPTLRKARLHAPALAFHKAFVEGYPVFAGVPPCKRVVAALLKREV